jgi:hypothetical protein
MTGPLPRIVRASRKCYYNGGHFQRFIRPVEAAGAKLCYMGWSAAGEKEGEDVGFSECAGSGFPASELTGPINRLQRAAFQFSQERMAATVLTNVVYPVYTRRSHIRHYTPGKWWDCLYTWDSGFIGLGLLELDLERAVDCLNAYTTPPGDQGSFFAPPAWFRCTYLSMPCDLLRSSCYVFFPIAPVLPLFCRAIGQLYNA